MMPDTNIEMLDDIIQGREQWLRETLDGRVCCGDGCYPSGGCFRNPLQKCVYFQMALRLLEREPAR